MQKTVESECVMGESSCGTSEADMSWPFRLKLLTDHLRWDSLKISPSDEFEEHVVAKLDESSRKSLDAQRPIEIHIIDVDIHESYRVNLVKKEAFWFEPFPDVKKQKLSKSNSKAKYTCCYNLSAMEQDSNHHIDKEKARQEFAYSLEPFRHIVKKRNLSYGQEIGLRWSGTTSTIQYDFSVLDTAKRGLDLHRFRLKG